MLAIIGKSLESVAKDRKGSGRFRFPFLGAPETKLPDAVDGNASEECLGKLQEDALAAAESETKQVRLCVTLFALGRKRAAR